MIFSFVVCLGFFLIWGKQSLESSWQILSIYRKKMDPFLFQQCSWGFAVALLPQYCVLISSSADSRRKSSVLMETVHPQTSDNQPNVGVMLQSDSDKVCKYLERSCSSSNAVVQSPSWTNPRLAARQLQNFIDEHRMNKQRPLLSSPAGTARCTGLVDYLKSCCITTETKNGA